MLLSPRSRRKINTVKSGISLATLTIDERSRLPVVVEDETHELQSRSARVLVAGAGFLADAYDLFVINLVLRLLRDEYPSYSADPMLVQHYEGLVASASLFGSIVGQLVAGFSADIVGRKIIFLLTAALITIGSIGSSSCLDSEDVSIYTQIACWRFFLGLGVGGEYPLAATVTSESSSAGSRGKLMVAVFSMQGIGALMSTFTVLACLGAGFDAGFSWRFSLAFGAVPAIFAFPWRLRMHETETFERLKNERKSVQDLAVDKVESRKYRDNSYSSLNSFSNHNNSISSDNDSWGSTNIQYPAGAIESWQLKKSNSSSASPAKISPNKRNNSNNNLFYAEMESMSVGDNDNMPIVADIPRNNEHTSSLQSTGRWGEIVRAFALYKWHIIGTSSCWFLLDATFYANGLFNHDVTSLIIGGGQSNTTSASTDAINSAFICIVGIPGYLLSMIYIDTLGRKNIQMLGFGVLAVAYSICCFGHNWFMYNDGTNNTQIKKYCYLVIYALTFLFSNFGPNTTSFVIPGEIYPAQVRATCHGISAACGKAGAAFGAYYFPLFGYKTSMFYCSVIAACGLLMTYLFIPRYESSDLKDEDQYIQLEHPWLWPLESTIEEILFFKRNSAEPEFIHVFDSSVELNVGINNDDDDKERKASPE